MRICLSPLCIFWILWPFELFPRLVWDFRAGWNIVLKYGIPRGKILATSYQHNREKYVIFPQSGEPTPSTLRLSKQVQYLGEACFVETAAIEALKLIVPFFRVPGSFIQLPIKSFIRVINNGIRRSPYKTKLCPAVVVSRH